jgi:hypothetical protein
VTIRFETLKIGDALPEHESGPISRHVLALYCGASGDHNPLHVDIDYAKSFGMSDVFAHGMLSMAYMAQLLTRWVPQRQIRSFGVRFMSITPVYAKVLCSGKIVERLQVNGENCVRLELRGSTNLGVQTLAGDAVIALPE